MSSLQTACAIDDRLRLQSLNWGEPKLIKIGFTALTRTMYHYYFLTILYNKSPPSSLNRSFYEMYKYKQKFA